MSITRRVSVERNRLRFAAAHMATFHDDLEPLHGHNYELIVDVEGELTEDGWVWDFGDLKDAAKAIADELDHRFLLQAASTLLEIHERTDGWEIRFRGRTYIFPHGDVVALPIANSTAELLAEWVATRLGAALKGRPGSRFRKLTVGVEEMPGQAGWCTVELESQG